MRSLTISLLFFALTVPSVALGHGIWFTQRTGDLTLVFGHGAQDLAYEADKVKSVVSVSQNGERRDVELIRNLKNVNLSAVKDAVALVTFFDNGSWIKNGDGKWQNVGKLQVAGGSESHRAVKYNTHLAGKSRGPIKPTGAALEIVPLRDPMSLKLGAALPVQVLLFGKPYKNARLRADYLGRPGEKTTTSTDAQGKVTLRIATDALNVISVEFDEKTPNHPDVDEISHLATLSFVLPHKE